MDAGSAAARRAEPMDPAFDQTRRPDPALRVGRVAAIVTAIGAATSPPLAVAGSVAMLVALAWVSDARARLGAALRSPLGLGLAALGVALLLAAATGLALHGQPQLVARGLMDWRHLLLVPVALALYAARDPQARRWTRIFAVSWVVFAAVAALAALAAVALGLGRPGYAAGVLLRNNVTQSMVMASGMLVAGVLLGGGGTRAGRVALVAAIALAACAMLLIQPGRSGVIALVVAASIACWQLARSTWRWLGPVTAAGVAAAAWVALPDLQQRFEQGVQEMRAADTAAQATSMGIRVVIWRTTADLIAERPLLGHGLGGYERAYADHIGRRHPEGWQAMAVADAHNQYLFVWAQAGLPGLAGFLAFLLGALRQPAAHPQRAIGLALLGAWSVTSLFSSHFQTFSEGHMIAVLLGVFLAGPAQAASSSASIADSTSADSGQPRAEPT
jgi:O-antigen ligase